MSSRTFTPSRGAIYGALATWAWISLPTGVYLAMSGNLVWGLLLAAGAVALLVIGATSGVGVLRSRQISRTRGYVMLFGFAGSAIISALYSISLFQPTRSLSIVGTLHAAGIILLGAWATIALFGSITRSGFPSRSRNH